MKILWIVAVGLGLLYLAIWTGIKGGPETPATPRPTPTADSKTTLSEAARGDAIGRVGSNATVKITSIKPQTFIGPELTPSAVTADGAVVGFVVTLEADIGGKPQAKLIYHVAPPDTVKFVRQTAP